MDPNRQTRQDPDAPPAWTRFHELCTFGWPPRYILSLNALRPTLGSIPAIDHRGILITSEAAMHRRSGRVLAWVRDFLGLQHCEAWKREPPAYLKALLKSFYEENGACTAWAFVESCRDPIRKRHVGYGEEIQESTKPNFLFSSSQLHRFGLPLRHGIRLPSKRLYFAAPYLRPEGDTHVTQFTVKRTFRPRAVPLESPLLTYQWTGWCLATEGEDDLTMAKGHIPAGLRCLLPTGVNGARLLCWVKMDDRTGMTANYTVDLDPETGHVISIRYALAPLRMLTEMDPWLDDWLLTAIRYG